MDPAPLCRGSCREATEGAWEAVHRPHDIPEIYYQQAPLVVRHEAQRRAVSGDATPAGAFVAYYKQVCS